MGTYECVLNKVFAIIFVTEYESCYQENDFVIYHKCFKYAERCAIFVVLICGGLITKRAKAPLIAHKYKFNFITVRPYRPIVLGILKSRLQALIY